IPPGWRLSAGSVSRSPVAAATTSSAPIALSTTNTPRHVVTVSTWPPITGARIGARPLTSMSSEKNRAAANPECMPRTIARPTRTPAAPSSPGAKRRSTSTATDGATAHSSDTTEYAATPTSSGPRRPKRAGRGPARICPSARPDRHAVSVSCTAQAGASRSRPSPGRPGSYMSIESGPNALSAPRMRTTFARPRGEGRARRCPGGTLSRGDGSSLGGGGKQQRDARRIADEKAAGALLDRNPRAVEALAHRVALLGSIEHDGPMPQAGGRLRGRWGRAPLAPPGVEAEVMVVAAGRDEHRVAHRSRDVEADD